ncbi:MAG: O-antigen ligase family protein [Gallionella sp.]|nr:O-antigen ligase family protein [Gallionella sp.]
MKKFVAPLPPPSLIPVGAPGNLCWPDRFIIITLFCYFLAYPFALRNLMGVIYPLALTGLLIVVALACTLGKAPVLMQGVQRGDRMLKVGLLLYGLYFAILMLASILHSAESIVAISAVYEMRELMFALIILFLLSDRGVLFSLRLYVEVLTWCSVLGLLLVFLNYVGVIYPITEVNLDNLPGGGENRRLFFGIGFIWPNTWLGSPLGLERLQSFADEAGTFGFAVLPAILLATYWRMKGRVLIMTVALIFTFSVGAILAWLFITLFGFSAAAKYERGKVKRIVTVLLLVSVFLLIANYLPFDLLEQFNRYLSAKYTSGDSEGTSVGSRLAALEIALDAIKENPFGFGANSSGLSLNLGNASLAIGWFVPLVEAGVLGWLIYVLAFGAILVHALHNAISSKNIGRICAIVILVNGYAAFQRAGIDANIWQLFWLIIYIRVNGMLIDNVGNSVHKEVVLDRQNLSVKQFVNGGNL